MISLIFLISLQLAITQAQILKLSPIFLLQQNIATQLKGLSQFTFDKVQINNSKISIIFGGRINNITQNILIISNQTNQTSIKYNNNNNSNSNLSMPIGRYWHCSIVYKDVLYIYGGVGQSGQILQDLWVFNFTTLQWSLLAISNFTINHCKLAINNNNIYIFGINDKNILSIWKYQSINNIWSIKIYTYGSSVISQGIIWDNSVKYTQTNIINIMSTQNINYTNMSYTNQLSATKIFIHQMPTNNTNTNNNNNYIIVTNNQILSLNISSLQIKLIRNLEQDNSNYESIISQQWLFIIKNNISPIFITYYNIYDFWLMGIKQYINPHPNYKIKINIYNNDIYVISQGVMDGWVIYNNCNNIYNNSVYNNSNVQICFYGQIFCKQGYRGQNCSEQTCPNTLILIDYVIYSKILIQCNNHGKCTANGCVCDEYWTGQDCSIYTRKICYGELIQNWPINNCECLPETVGGNNCQVTFCYNDCNNNGVCQSTGQCICNAGYYGADCSIAIIQFPGATISI